MYTKTMLQEQFSISDNTVTETLKACGLDTSKQEYTKEEIELYFAPARQLLGSKKNGKRVTYKDIKEHFATKSAEAKDFPSESKQGAAEGEQSEVLQVIYDETVTSLEVMTQAIVADAIQLLPQMAAKALSEASHRGELKRVFGKYREDFIKNAASLSFTPSSSPKQLGGVPEEEEPNILVGWDEEEEDLIPPPPDVTI